ncbi:MAG: glycosyltransferase family 2 protein [Methanoregula sp.]
MTEQETNFNPLKKFASIIIVTYNHKHFLRKCLDSVLNQEYPHEIILVDNCSGDGTVSYVREYFPTVKIIENLTNAGYGAGNNLGIKHARGEYIVILNPDTIVHEGWLTALISPLECEVNVITTPKILTYDGFTINTCGNINHFTGLNFTRGLGANPDQYQNPSSTGGISGACFAIRKHDYISLGGFDEVFFVYNEDSDFSWNAFQRGYTIKYIPNSVLQHHYTLKVSPEKLYHLEKGRYIILRKYFSRKDMILLSPSLSVTEILTWGYSLKQGKKGIRNKIKAMTEGLQQPIKKVRCDKDLLLSHLDAKIPDTQLISNVLERVIIVIGNCIFLLNYSVIK